MLQNPCGHLTPEKQTLRTDTQHEPSTKARTIYLNVFIPMAFFFLLFGVIVEGNVLFHFAEDMAAQESSHQPPFPPSFLFPFSLSELRTLNYCLG